MRILTLLLCVGLLGGYLGWQFVNNSANQTALIEISKSERAVQLDVTGMT
jgi:hypothetical protein